jgi:hypothetical protein
MRGDAEAEQGLKKDPALHHGLSLRYASQRITPTQIADAENAPMKPPITIAQLLLIPAV